MRHLEDEDRDFVLFLLSLEEDEFKMMINSMTEEEAMVLLNNVQLCREELFDNHIERNGTPEADKIIERIMNL